jgi:Protein of unknown function (DUF2889)
MERAALDKSPGFRRRFRVTPLSGSVCIELEDDFHSMSVTVHHNAGVATSIAAVMHRAPWTTCPGAVAQLKQTFTGVRLAEFAQRGEKRSNCTHLHDLATLGAAHVSDPQPLVYDVLTTDPIEGRRETELRRNGAPVLRWTLAGFRLLEPAGLAGMSLDKLNPWISTLEPQEQEEARVLRWGTMIANGRTIPLEQQSDATRMPPGNCYTFQPHRMTLARRVGEIRDFSRGAGEPLSAAVRP